MNKRHSAGALDAILERDGLADGGAVRHDAAVPPLLLPPRDNGGEEAVLESSACRRPRRSVRRAELRDEVAAIAVGVGHDGVGCHTEREHVGCNGRAGLPELGRAIAGSVAEAAGRCADQELRRDPGDAILVLRIAS